MSRKMSPEELEQFIHRELRALPPRQAPAGFEARLQAALEARARPAEQLEQLIHRELNALPLRQAPATLEARVLAAIEREAVVAWYHKSWAYWPAAVRAAFLGFATAVSGAVVAVCYALMAGFETSAVAAETGARFGWVVKLYHAGLWCLDLGRDLFASIPPLWLYGGLAFVAVMYVSLFSLGAVAYRTLLRPSA